MEISREITIHNPQMIEGDPIPIKRKLIYRDDDCPIHAFKDFVWVHETLREAGIVHTVALICRNLDRYRDYVDYIKSDPEFFDPQFHCLDHINHPQNHDIVYEQFDEGTKMFKSVFGIYPTVWYPTWNLSDAYCNDMAQRFGMVSNPKKFSFGQFLRKPEAVMQSENPVLNYHHWSKEEREMLPQVIKLYKSL